MSKQKWNLNTIYISERLQESLLPISRCPMTVLVAPMGYGKTTTVNWYLAERIKMEAPRVIRISVYSNNLAIFWKSVQTAFSHAGLTFLQNYPCPTDEAGSILLMDDLCHELEAETPCYVFIDDFHLLSDARVSSFLCLLANRLPENVHLIVASRNRFLPAEEIVRLGSRVYQIGVEHLRLQDGELAAYAHRCGIAMSDQQMETLLRSSEGWFSAVYLHLQTLLEHGSLPERDSDIYDTFTAAMLQPLPPDKREFLAAMGLADEFTTQMAAFITGRTDAKALLTALTEQNAFVKQLPDGAGFRFHHMMKECAEREFLTLDPETQLMYQHRYGSWYEDRGQYLHAMAAYRKCQDYNALLRVVQLDAGILLASVKPSEVLDTLKDCPEQVLKEYPLAILVLMRSMFNWQMIPKMLQLKECLMVSLKEHSEWSEAERGNLLGECDLIMSFLCYNDISAMSRLHRSASNQMTRPAISIRNSGGWTFGSPSVLMMFHRESGALARELEEMDACMPYYYKITQGHGQGAETIMRGEAEYLQGHFADALIHLERAYAQITDNGQENMALCCDFLTWRLSLCTETQPQSTFEDRYTALLRHHNAAWLNIHNGICAYYYALIGDTKKIPAVFGEHQLTTVSLLAPGRPMYELIENQVYLAQGAFAKVIGRSESLLALCEELHYALVALHLRIQTAGAYVQLDKDEEAQALMEQAVQDALPDNLIMPFVENYRYLRPLLDRWQAGPTGEFVQRVVQMGRACRAQQKQPCILPPAALAVLTKREVEITALVAERLSNREIAEKLYLTEGSVKQYTNRIYSKLHIEGNTRAKRKQLMSLITYKP